MEQDSRSPQDDPDLWGAGCSSTYAYSDVFVFRDHSVFAQLCPDPCDNSDYCSGKIQKSDSLDAFVTNEENCDFGSPTFASEAAGTQHTFETSSHVQSIALGDINREGSIRNEDIQTLPVRCPVSLPCIPYSKPFETENLGTNSNKQLYESVGIHIGPLRSDSVPPQPHQNGEGDEQRQPISDRQYTSELGQKEDNSCVLRTDAVATDVVTAPLPQTHVVPNVHSRSWTNRELPGVELQPTAPPPGRNSMSLRKKKGYCCHECRLAKKSCSGSPGKTCPRCWDKCMRFGPRNPSSIHLSLPKIMIFHISQTHDLLVDLRRQVDEISFATPGRTLEDLFNKYAEGSMVCVLDDSNQYYSGYSTTSVPITIRRLQTTFSAKQEAGESLVTPALNDSQMNSFIVKRSPQILISSLSPADQDILSQAWECAYWLNVLFNWNSNEIYWNPLETLGTKPIQFKNLVLELMYSIAYRVEKLMQDLFRKVIKSFQRPQNELHDPWSISYALLIIYYSIKKSRVIKWDAKELHFLKLFLNRLRNTSDAALQSMEQFRWRVAVRCCGQQRGNQKLFDQLLDQSKAPKSTISICFEQVPGMFGGFNSPTWNRYNYTDILNWRDLRDPGESFNNLSGMPMATNTSHWQQFSLPSDVENQSTETENLATDLSMASTFNTATFDSSLVPVLISHPGFTADTIKRKRNELNDAKIGPDVEWNNIHSPAQTTASKNLTSCNMISDSVRDRDDLAACMDKISVESARRILLSDIDVDHHRRKRRATRLQDRASPSGPQWWTRLWDSIRFIV